MGISNRIIKLGKEIKISPKSVGFMTGANHSETFNHSMVKVEFSIGEGRMGYLFLELDALLSLQQGEKPKVTTHVELKNSLKQ
jgi:hypothetical protein